MRILFVEDDQESALVGSELLRFRGHLVTIARNGSEAITALRKANFDGTVVDVFLPDADGFSLAQVLLQMQPSLTCVIVSGHDLPGADCRARCLGAHFCCKPLDFAEVDSFLRVQSR